MPSVSLLYNIHVSLQRLIKHKAELKESKRMGSPAEQFSLSLGSKEPLVAKNGASAVCLVTSATLQFATDIREKIRFAVTRRTGPDQVKQKVANRQDLCCLSQDQKQFKFGFDLESSGIYKVSFKNAWRLILFSLE